MSREVVVECAAGIIVGSADEVDARFLGIPFAEAPLGERRFEPPVARARFETPFDATRYGATPQRGVPYADTTIPEPSIEGDDTLTLNVFAPLGFFADRVAARGTSPRIEIMPGGLDPSTSSGKLRPRRSLSVSKGGLLAQREGGAELAPVLVWIHGGGYLAGSAASPWYDGAAFTGDGIVFVSISYRLGVDGFAAIDGSVNRGVKDWMLALAWVRENIAAFGGDPERVAVAGQSAGGGAVLTLLAAPAAQPLFSRAMAFSPVDVSSTVAEAERFTRQLAAELGVQADARGLASIDEDTLQDAAIHWGERHPGAALLELEPVHGDELLPLSIREGLGVSGTDKPLLLGSTADEFDSPGFGGAPSEPAVFPRQTDTVFRAGCLRTARARASATAPTWLYSFDWPSPVLGGAAHCTDLPFFFDSLDAEGVSRVLGDEPPRALAAAAHAIIVDFVRGEAPSWQRATGVAGDAVLSLGDETAIVRGRYDDVLPLLDVPLLHTHLGE
jgi:carboxylesterase type B